MMHEALREDRYTDCFLFLVKFYVNLTQKGCTLSCMT